MINVTIEVSTDAERFLVAVCADSILHAVKRVEDVYRGKNFSVVFPLNPETFFNTDNVEATLEELGLSEGQSNSL